MSDWKKFMDAEYNDRSNRGNQGSGKFVGKPKGKEHKKDDNRKRRQAVRQTKEGEYA